jgi:hypothetical protein
MATTTNPSLSAAWSEIVDDATADFFLSLPFSTRTTVEVVAWANTGDEANVDVQGHQLRGDRIESMSRSVLGEGYIYARCLDGSVTVILST